MIEINMIRPKAKIKWTQTPGYRQSFNNSWFCSCIAIDYSGKELFLVCNPMARYPIYNELPFNMSNRRKDHYLSSEKFWHPSNFFELEKFNEIQNAIINEEHDAFMREAYPDRYKND